MSRKHRGAGPVPKGNRSRFGPRKSVPIENETTPAEGAPSSEQDPKRRLGNFGAPGEHPIEQPSGKQGPNR